MLRNCAADTLYGKADDKLSWIASRLIEIARSEQQSWEDLRAYHAPSECWTQVVRINESKKKTLLQLFDMDETEFLAAVRERTSERWVYYNLPF
jgi:hypothetical protein